MNEALKFKNTGIGLSQEPRTAVHEKNRQKTSHGRVRQDKNKIGHGITRR